MGRTIKMPSETTTFHPHNANPHGRRTGDCVIRALATVLDISWEKALGELYQMSLNLGYAPASDENYDRVLTKHAYYKMKQPRKSDNTRYRGYEFCEYLKNKYGTENPPRGVLAKIGTHHVTCFMWDDKFKQYKCWDIWDPTDDCVGNYWVDR